MTWGKQNTEAEAHEQMDYATEQGINFFVSKDLTRTIVVCVSTHSTYVPVMWVMNQVLPAGQSRALASCMIVRAPPQPGPSFHPSQLHLL